MELPDLRTFLSVIEERGFSRAAQRLGRTQPAVSQAIQRLEEELGESIFDRSSRDGALTDAGRVLLQYAERMLNLHREAHEAVQELATLQAGKLSIAANEFTSLYLVKVLQEYRRLHPMIHITVKRSLASRICQFVLDHDVELGMLSFRPDEARLSSVVVYRDQLIFVVSPEHPLARSRQVSIRQLGAESFVAHNVPSPYRAKVLEMFRRYQTPLHMDVELPTLEAIRRFVAAGRGVALIPRIAVETELERAELIEVGVKELQLERKLRVIYRAGSPLSHAASAFLALVEEWASKNKAGFLSQKERLGSGRRAPAES